MIDIGDRYGYRELDYRRELGIRDENIGNMSFCTLPDGNRLVSVRQFDYLVEPVSGSCVWMRRRLQRGHRFLVADRNFRFIRLVTPVKSFLDDYDDPETEIFDTTRLEDIRLVRHWNKIQASYTDNSYGKGRYRVGASTFRLDGDMMRLEKSVTFNFTRQKNYMPLSDKPGVFVSDLEDNAVTTVSMERPGVKCRSVCYGARAYRGSTQLERVGDGYVAIVHRAKDRRYCNAFARFSDDMKKCSIGPEFTVMSSVGQVNFLCGMSIENGEAVLPFCILDRTTLLFRIPLDDLCPSL